MMLQSKSIGNKIAEARKQINASQSELAQQISVSPQAVGKWERGESLPDIITLNRLAEIFKVDLNYFSDSFNSTEVAPKQQQATAPMSKIRNFFEWNWDMSEGNWADADFSGLKNLKEKFSSSNIRNCKFLNSDLSGLTLGNNNTEKCDFTASDMRDSKIQSSNLLSCQFDGCSFIDAEFFKNNISKCSFNNANFSGAAFLNTCLERNTVDNAVWKFTTFKNTSISDTVFEGSFEDCHFENCAFYGVKFQNSVIKNTFFKYNRRLKKVEFINCKVDKMTYAFLKNNQSNLSGITLLEAQD